MMVVETAAVYTTQPIFSRGKIARAVQSVPNQVTSVMKAKP